MATITNKAHVNETDSILFIKWLESYSESGWVIIKVKTRSIIKGVPTSYEAWAEKVEMA